MQRMKKPDVIDEPELRVYIVVGIVDVTVVTRAADETDGPMERTKPM